MFGNFTQSSNNSTQRGGRQFRSPIPNTVGPASFSGERKDSVNFTPLGQHPGGQQGVYSGMGFGGGGGNCFIPATSSQYLSTTQALRDIAFQTGMGRHQPWPLPTLGREGFDLPVGNGGFGQKIGRLAEISGVGGQERNCKEQLGAREVTEEFRMVRHVSPREEIKHVRQDHGNKFDRSGRDTESRSPSRKRCSKEGSRNRLSGSRAAVSRSESVFGDKGVVDPWGNWHRDRDVNANECGERSSRTRKEDARNEKKQPRSGRRATSIRKGRSRSRSPRYVGRRGNNTEDMNDKMKRQEKRLAEKKRYEEERLKQVKRREDRLLREEEKLQQELMQKEIDAQEKIEYIKREERRVKQLEIERLKREKDLYLREKLLKEQKERKSEERHVSPIIIQRGLSRRRRSYSPNPSQASSTNSRQSRSRRHDFKVSTSLSSSPVNTDAGGKSRRVRTISSSVSPLRSPFRRSPRPKAGVGRYGKTSCSGIKKINITNVDTAREKCNQCGGPSHGLNNSHKERKLECPAFGLKCKVCHRLNHLAKVCRDRSRKKVVEIDDTSVLDRLGPKLPVSARLGMKKKNRFSKKDEEENNNSYDREIFTTVDEVGYTEVSAKEIEVKNDEKVPIDLDKVVIKKRVKKM